MIVCSKANDHATTTAAIEPTLTNGVIDVSYVPCMLGEHVIDVLLRDEHLPGSPFEVVVQPGMLCAAKCIAYGAGVEDPTANTVCRFTINSRDSLGNPINQGGAIFDVSIETLDTATIPQPKPTVTDNDDGSYGVSYLAPDIGDVSINVKLQRLDGSFCSIVGSPFTTTIRPQEVFAYNCTATGKAVDGPLTAGEIATFTIHTRDDLGRPVWAFKAEARSIHMGTMEPLITELEPQQLGDYHGRCQLTPVASNPSPLTPGP